MSSKEAPLSEITEQRIVSAIKFVFTANIHKSHLF